ncbi:MAG: class I SAM-dependent methyltransferase [Egibacteraceae bacterium]
MARGRAPRNRSWAWVRRAVQAAVLAGLVVDTAKLRRRVAGLRVLADCPPPADHRYQVLTADGVRIDAGCLSAARAHTHAEGLAALDLVPRDLPAAQALDLLREVDPAAYRTDRLAAGRGACHAVLADDRLLRAAGITSNRGNHTAPELAAAMVQLKLHAPASTDLVVTPQLASGPDIAAQNPEIVAALHGTMTGLALAPHMAWMSALFASGLFGPAWTATVLAAWSAQPLLVFAGSRTLKPCDLWSYSATRTVEEPARLIAALCAARRLASTEADPVEIRRPTYQADLADGTGRFFQPKRIYCPWCGSTDLRARLCTTDLLQHKPGLFSLDQCQGCGHIFQNPRLSADGVEFYYRDCYDGLGEQRTHWLSGLAGWMYQLRAETLKSFDEPKSWLDVGTGHGHFCNVARDVWPQTAFDGLDQSFGVKLAEQRSWVDRGYRGSFVDLAPDLAGAYDVVSMFHYLEHTMDPQRELEAAHMALRPGGHLLIEVPDPESRWATLLGKWWPGWLQPQHLHLIPVGNLRRRLEELGFAVVLEQHAEAHAPIDLVVAALLALSLIAPTQNLPWLPHPPDRLRRLVRNGMIAAGIPVLVGATLADRMIAPIGRNIGLSNAYRVLARKH